MTRLRSSYRRTLQWSVETDDRFIVALLVVVHLMAFVTLAINRCWPA